MARPKGISMHKAKKAKVEGTAPNRNTAGRRPKTAVEAAPAEAVVEEAAALPAAASRHAPDDAAVEANEPAAAPPEPAAARMPIDKRPCAAREAALKRARVALRRARIIKAWDNSMCDCAEMSAPAPGEPDFIEHHMLCQIHRCYAYEIGCCDGVVFDDELTRLTDEEHVLPCMCIAPAFGIPQCEGFWGHYGEDDPRQRYTVGHRDDACWHEPVHAGRNLKPSKCCVCGRPDPIPCLGRYVPMCPARRHAVSGKMRGDLVAEQRGHAIENGWSFVGTHLPTPPGMSPDSLARLARARRDMHVE